LSWPLTGVGILMIVVMGSYTLVVLGREIRPLVRKARGHLRNDPQLGTLDRNEAAHYWTATMTVGDRTVDVVIAGDDEPNPELLAAARQLVADFAALERRADVYLTTEAKEEEDPELALDIRALRISSIKLWTPDRPAHVVLDFEGLDEGRYWYCQCVDGEFSDLRFDT
jgi:hypothetical protein